MPFTTIRDRALRKAEVAGAEAFLTRVATKKLLASSSSLSPDDPLYEAFTALRSATWAMENNRDRFLTLAAFAERQESNQRATVEAAEILLNALKALRPYLQETGGPGELRPSLCAEQAIAKAEVLLVQTTLQEESA